ncbi:MarR family transcriptional regulator [Alteromonadaceae bacterium M269]|nr:MarR family transcriptional regulator [Alteromonadaceae bacterium M269]
MNKENEIYTLIERIGNLLKAESRAKGAELGLQAVQQDTLYYLSICNRYSDHLLALTKFLGLTKGTVAQTVKIVEKKGLVTKEKDAVDKRMSHLILTEEGRQHIENSAPPDNFISTIGSLSEKQKGEFLSQLRTCLMTYQNFNQVNGFGVCQSCTYNMTTEDGFQCGLTKEKLSESDVQKICVEFEPSLA